jgi:hypothetical protein
MPGLSRILPQGYATAWPRANDRRKNLVESAPSYRSAASNDFRPHGRASYGLAIPFSGPSRRALTLATLVAAGISIAIIAVVKNIGITLNTKFTSVNTQLR